MGDLLISLILGHFTGVGTEGRLHTDTHTHTHPETHTLTHWWEISLNCTKNMLFGWWPLTSFHCLLTWSAWPPSSSTLAPQTRSHTLAGGWVGTPPPPSPAALFPPECVWLETNKEACWRLQTQLGLPCIYIWMSTLSSYLAPPQITFNSQMKSLCWREWVCAMMTTKATLPHWSQ